MKNIRLIWRRTKREGKGSKEQTGKARNKYPYDGCKLNHVKNPSEYLITHTEKVTAWGGGSVN